VIPTEWTCLVRRGDIVIEEGNRGLLQMGTRVSSTSKYRLKTQSISSSVQAALRCTSALRFCSIDYHSPRNPAHEGLSHF
jgi:hypothetical protein